MRLDITARSSGNIYSVLCGIGLVNLWPSLLASISFTTALHHRPVNAAKLVIREGSIFSSSLHVPHVFVILANSPSASTPLCPLFGTDTYPERTGDIVQKSQNDEEDHRFCCIIDAQWIAADRLGIADHELIDLQCLITTYGGISGHSPCQPWITATCQLFLVLQRRSRAIIAFSCSCRNIDNGGRMSDLLRTTYTHENWLVTAKRAIGQCVHR